jgi:hypothetical protein
MTTPKKTPPAASTITDIVAVSQQRLSRAVMEILNSRVSEGTKKGYCNANAQFATWIYLTGEESQNQLLEPWFKEEMDIAREDAIGGVLLFYVI